MYEFWLKEKLIFIIGLFQFGLILIMFTIINLSKLIWRRLNLDKGNQNNLNENASALISPSLSNESKDVVNNIVDNEKNLEANLTESSEELLINQPELTNTPAITEDELAYKIDIDPELLTEIKEISSDPAATIDEAIRWWLRRRTFDVLDATSDRPYRVGMKSNRSKRSSSDLWND